MQIASAYFFVHVWIAYLFPTVVFFLVCCGPFKSGVCKNVSNVTDCVDADGTHAPAEKHHSQQGYQEEADATMTKLHFIKN